VIKFLWLQGLGEKASHAQLLGTPAESVLSFSTVQQWLRGFKKSILRVKKLSDLENQWISLATS
jgi:hypothetical protein